MQGVFMQTTDVRREIGYRLQKGMTKYGLTAYALSVQSGLPLHYIDQYLKGKREIRFDELRPVCDALDISLMRLLVRPDPFAYTVH